MRVRNHPTASRRVALLAPLLIAAVSIACASREAPAPSGSRGSPAADPEPIAGDPAPLGEGFVVWESDRSGAARIWTRRLDGSGLRQLTPDEPGRQHCCPHVSPDGSRLAYLSLQMEHPGYPPGDGSGALHVMRMEGRDDRVVAPEARTYDENRAAVWRTDDELFFIAGDGRTRRLRLATGESEPVLPRAEREFGWLPDATLSHATTGVPTFSPLDPASHAVAERTPLGGCQPYFSHDGRFGFWSAGAGGPLKRMDLATRAVSTILEKHDERLPKERGYAYFPMFARSGLAFAFAASNDDHDHFKADYDVFVAPSDPDTLELVGQPVRYTARPGSDRFPDVFVAPLPLGRRFGKAPFSVRLATAGMEGEWDWDWGDGTRSRSAAGEHAFARAGCFTVRARRAGVERGGIVIVAPARPPRALGAELRGDRLVVVRYDEPVAVASARAALASGGDAVAIAPGEDGRSLVATLGAPLAAADELVVSGVTDRAQVPSPAPPEHFPIAPAAWPARRDGLVFLWEAADRPNLVTAGGTERTYALEARGKARVDHDQAMSLGGGSFLAPDEAAEAVATACRGTNELTLELVLASASLDTPGPSTIVALGERRRERNFTLGADRDGLVLGLRTERHDSGRWVRLAALPDTRPHHLLVTYTPGVLAAYLDGEPVLASQELQGDFFHWKPRPLVFGAEPGGQDAWRGTIAMVAVRERALDAQASREEAGRARRSLAAHVPVPRLEVQATLLRRSKFPTLEEISPYRDALVVDEYRVDRVLAGYAPAGLLAVARHALLNGEPTAAAGALAGRPYRLALEPFDRNPQLQSLYVSDTLGADPGRALYYDTAW